MPENGLVFQADAYEWRLSSSGSNSHSGACTATYGHSAFGTTQFAPNAINMSVGITLSTDSSFDGTSGTWTAFYDGPGAPFGGYTVSGGSYRSGVSIWARARGIKIYCMNSGSLFKIVWSAVEIYVNGSLNTTLAGSSVDLNSAGCGPNYIPLIGYPLEVYGGASGGVTGCPTWTYNGCDPDAGLPIEWDTDTTGSVEAGFRWKDLDGSWVQVPVRVSVAEPPSGVGCPFGLTVGSILSGSDSSGVSMETRSHLYSKFEYVGQVYPTSTGGTVTCTDSEGGGPPITYDCGPAYFCFDCEGHPSTTLYYQDEYKTTTKSDTIGGGFTVTPELPRSIIRMNNDYAALIIRPFQFPQAKALAARECTDGATTVSVSDNPEILPFADTFLGVLTNATHAMEDVLTKDLPLFASVSSDRTEVVTRARYAISDACIIDPPIPPGYTCDGGCGPVMPPITPNVNKHENASYTYPSSVGSCSNYQNHAISKPRLWATWYNPLWNFGYYRDDWDTDGSATSWDDYWGPIKEQWLEHASLPTHSKTRNSMIASPLQIDQGNTPFLDAYFGTYRWMGISRWQTLDTTPVSSLTLSTTHPGSWSSSNCTTSLGAGGITVGSFIGSNFTVDLDLGNWAVDPYLIFLLTKQITVNWDLTNVSLIAVSVIGQDGKETTLGTTRTTYTLPTGGQNKYVGSWGIDNGYGVVADLGVDTRASGYSTTWMADPEDSTGFELGAGRQFAKLRFTVVPTNPASSVLINWPTFTFESGASRQVWENSKALSMIWADGPMVRWGQQQWYDIVFGFQDPPLVAGMGTPSTIIDAMAYRYRVLLGAGGASVSSTITTDLTSLFDSFEGQSIAVVDKFSCAFVLPNGSGGNVRFALVNSFSEVPPLGLFPVRTRSASTWNYAGSFEQTVYDYCQDPRFIVSGSDYPAKLQTDAGVDSGSAVASPPSGWYLWTFNPVLNNSETNWKIVSGTDLYAKVRPWHGWSCLLKQVNFGFAGHLSNSPPVMWHYVGKNSLDELFHYRFNFSGSMKEQYTITTDSEIRSAQIGFSANGILTVVYDRSDDSIWIVESFDFGKTWGTCSVLTVGGVALTGQYPAIACHAESTDYLFVSSGGNLKQYHRPKQGAWVAISDALTGTSATRAGAVANRNARNRIALAHETGFFDQMGQATGFSLASSLAAFDNPSVASFDNEQTDYLTFYNGTNTTLLRRLDRGLFISPGTPPFGDENATPISAYTGPYLALAAVVMVGDNPTPYVSMDRGASWTLL